MRSSDLEGGGDPAFSPSAGVSHENGPERLFNWTGESVRWYRDACAWPANDRDRVLSSLIRRHAGEGRRVIEPGCGIGNLGCVLASFSESVLGIDVNPRAVSACREMISSLGLTNMSALEADFEEYPLAEGEFDLAVLCMFGFGRELMDRALRTAGTVVLIENTVPKNPGPVSSAELIGSAGLSFVHESVRVSFGQPLRGIGDAVAWLRHYYDPESDCASLTRRAEETARPTGDEAFPLFIPKTKSYEFFCFGA